MSDAQAPAVPGYRGIGFAAQVERGPGLQTHLDNYVYCAGNRLAYFSFTQASGKGDVAVQEIFIAAFQLPVPA